MVDLSNANAGPPPAWVLEPWDDLAARVPGQHVVDEAVNRRRRGQDDASWRQGAAGEVRVAVLLEDLVSPRGLLARWRGRSEVPWQVLHSVPVGLGCGDIDHVLIGPAGLITINTKHHQPRRRFEILDGEIRVGRDRTHYVAKARAESDRAHRLLTSAAAAHLAHLHARTPPTPGAGGPVATDPAHLAILATGNGLPPWPLATAVLAIVGGAPLRSDGTPVRGVNIVRAADLVHRIRSLPTVLDAATAAAAYALARRSTTWSREPD